MILPKGTFGFVGMAQQLGYANGTDETWISPYAGVTSRATPLASMTATRSCQIALSMFQRARRLAPADELRLSTRTLIELFGSVGAKGSD